MTNVLLIYADDMRFDFLPYMPNVQNLLVKPGRNFTQARCNVPLCGPSRAGLLTGEWSIHSGNLGMQDLPDHNNTIGDWMQAEAYRTGLIGKYLNAAPPLEGTDRPTGWSTWLQLVSDQSQYGFSVCDGISTEPVTVSQMDYLESESLSFVAGPEPWFLTLTPSTPHSPLNPFPEDLFDWSHVKWPIVLRTPSNSPDMPPWIAGAANAPGLSDVPRFQAVARGQLRELNRLDRMIGALVAALAASDSLEHTVIILSSDNGLYYGEHRNNRGGIAKNDLYDVSLRVPLVVKGPDVTPGVSDEVVSVGGDITKTVAALAGATVGFDEPNTRDLLDVINNPGAYADRAVLSSRTSGQDPNFALTPNLHDGDSITTPTRKLMHWSAVDDHWHSLPLDDRYEAYDLDEDPHEHRNWAKDPARAAERFDLVNQLRVLLDLQPFTEPSQL